LVLAGRLLASLAAAVIGWAVGNAATAALILLQSPSFAWQGWAMASGAVCAVAWAMAGIPLAISGIQFPAGPRRARAVLLAGLGACGVMCLFFGPAALTSSAGRLMLLIVAGQALATGGASMLIYCLLSGSSLPAERANAKPAV